MKKQMTGILLAGMMLVFAGCSGAMVDPGPQTQSPETESSDSAQEATSEETPREPRIEDNYIGAWYASPQGFPMTLLLQDDDTYLLSIGIAAEEDAASILEKAAASATDENAEVQSGTWKYDDGFIFLDDDTHAPLDVRSDMLIWTALDMFFTRDVPYMYEEAALRTDLKSGDFDGYWTSDFVGLQGYTISAQAIDDNTDIYIEGENVALGGDIFGDDIAKFTLSDGQLTFTDGTGAEKITITIGIQEDGYMRLVMNGAESGDDEALTIFLSRVLSEEEREQLELEMQEQQDAEGDNEP